MIVSFSQKTLGQSLQNVSLDLNTVDQTIAAVLARKGFKLVDATALEAEKLRQTNLADKPDMKALEAASHLSQVVINGQASVQDMGPSPYNERIHSYGAFLTAKVFETGTGRILATGSTEATVPHQSFAIGTQKAAQKAAEKLAEKLSAAIAKGWLDACYNEHDVAVIVEEISFGKLEELRNRITDSIQGVLRVSQKGFLKSRAELSVGWKNCNTQRFAQLLDGLSVDSGRIIVQEAYGNTIRVKYVLH
jgi:hypothetical protein